MAIQKPDLQAHFSLSARYWYHVQQELPPALPLTLKGMAFSQLYLLWHKDYFFKIITHSKYFPHVYCQPHLCLFGNFCLSLDSEAHV